MLTIVYSLMVVIAVGLLIFVHELGHFLVAKKVGIRVEAFALGFGPRIFGFTRGDTEYKLCAVPLGGYVKMFGEIPGESDVRDPGAFNNKTISQRAWVISAGVIMNVIFAFILFPLAFSIGVPFDAPIVGAVTPGGPAWQAGLRRGDEIVAIDGNEVYGFNDIRVAVAFGDGPSEFKVKRKGVELVKTVTPIYNDGAGYNVIGISGQRGLPRFAKNAKALDAGIKETDAVVAINGVSLTNVSFFEQMAEGLIDPSASSLVFTVRDAEDENAPTRDVEVPADLGPIGDRPSFWAGVRFSLLRVKALAEVDKRAGFAASLGLKPKDIFRSVNGKPVFSPYSLRRAIEGLSDAAVAKLDVERDGTVREFTFVKAADSADELLDSMSLDADGVRIEIIPDGPAAKGGLQDGDRIVAAAGEELSQDNRGKEAFAAAIGASRGSPLAVRVERNGEVLDLTIPVTERLYNRTLQDLQSPPLHRKVKVPFPESLAVGSKQTWNQLVNIVLSLRSLITGKVAAKNMGGIISIAVISYSFAEQGIAKILFFMAILSLNLAILNILPIPVLDGGHLMFLILEKIKGGPLSDRAMGMANLGGMVLIVGLMVFVTFNDVMRHFF
ncbi:MAG: RIP metalloprotease RseP [Planctomycetota bacterium]